MSDPSIPLTGGCNCGAVRFELTETPLRAGYCHCTRCQRRTGTAASPSAIADAGTFRIVSGEDHIRRWNAGDGATKAFCGTCGSALFGQHPENPETINVRMGSFDGDPGVRPMGRLHVASAAVWEPIPDDGLPRLPRASRSIDPRRFGNCRAPSLTTPSEPASRCVLGQKRQMTTMRSWRSPSADPTAYRQNAYRFSRDTAHTED